MVSMTPEEAPEDLELPPVLEIRDLSKHYGKVHALRGLDLTIREGEVYGFLGRNGAGKSTAIRIIMGITRATSGEVRLFGGSGRDDVIALRRRIGYVAQEQNFYGWMSPIQLGRFLRGFYPTWDDGEYGRLLDVLELPAGRKVRTFSGGMKVKLALAAALAHRPQLLVLDEPTAGLDPVARREFLEMVRVQAESSRRTTFFSTHLVDEVELAANKVGVVDSGRTRFEGTVDELRGRVRALRGPAQWTADVPVLVPEESGARFRILRDEAREDGRILVIEATAADVFDVIRLTDDRWSLGELALEEVFIEMVRRPFSR